MDNTYNRLREAVAALPRWRATGDYAYREEEHPEGPYIDRDDALAIIDDILSQFPAQPATPSDVLIHHMDDTNDAVLRGIDSGEVEVDDQHGDGGAVPVAATFFSYDPQGDFITDHATAAAARAAAEEALGYYRDDAPDGWNEEVANVCWGMVMGAVEQTECRPITDEDRENLGISADCSEFVEYELVDYTAPPSSIDPAAEGLETGQGVVHTLQDAYLAGVADTKPPATAVKDSLTTAAAGVVVDPWRGLYLPEEATRDAEGLFWHPDLPTWDDGREDSIEPLVRAQGFEIRSEDIEVDDDIAMAGDDRYWQALSAWQPEQLSDDWRLAAVVDSEDGPAAWFVRPLALAGQAKTVES